MATVHALHDSCMACRAGADGLSPADECIAFLFMLNVRGVSSAQLAHDLCFHHRAQYRRCIRLYEEVVKKAKR